MIAARGVFFASLLVAVPASADPPSAPPLVCLAPRADSTDHHAKKDPHARRTEPALRTDLLTLVSIHTREALVLDVRPSHDDAEALTRFFRDRTSWEVHALTPGCLATLRSACAQLAGRRVEVVSAYRSDKLNEMLRKKGHHVARHSQHTMGHALDFRIVGVDEPVLYRWVQRGHRGGVGRYRTSGFVHVDTGPERGWAGD